jgi:hypothetical protein
MALATLEALAFFGFSSADTSGFSGNPRKRKRGN